MAKLLCDHGINMGQNKLFQWLRDHKYFTKHKVHDGNKKGNKPYQSYINAGYFVVKESTFLLNNGRTSVTLTPYVTGKGQIYLLNKIIEDKNK